MVKSKFNKNSLHEFNSRSEVWDKFQLYELCSE